MKKHFSFRQMPNVFTTVSRHCNGGRTGVGIDVNSPSPHSSKWGLGKVSTLILLFALSFGFSSQAWADDWTRNYVAMTSSNPNNYTAGLAANRSNDLGDDKWENETLQPSGITLDGYNLYEGSFWDRYAGLQDLYFKLTDGSTEKKSKNSISEWTGVGNIKDRVYNLDNESWYDLLTMGKSKIYFNATNWTSTTIKLVVAHAHYAAYYQLSNIANTKLYYGNPDLSGWKDAMGIGVVGNSGAAGGFYQFSDIPNNAAEYTGLKHYGLNNNNDDIMYFITPAGKGENPSCDYSEHYTDLNKTQTVKVMVKKAGSSNYTEETTFANRPGSIKATRYKLNSNGAGSADKTDANLENATFTSVITSQATLTATAGAGYVCKGWGDASNSAPSGNATKTYTVSDATTSYVFFEEQTYTVNFDVHSTNHGGIEVTAAGEQIQTGANVKASVEVVFTATPNEGYHVEGWYNDSGCSTGKIDAAGIDDTYTINSLNAAANVYVKFAANTYTVKFNGNESTSGSMSNQSFTYDEAAKALTKNTYSRTGYTFLGWNTDKNAATAQYQDEESVSNLTTNNGGTVNLYAVWQINPYDITYPQTYEHYTLTANQTHENYNTTINFTVTPDAGYYVVVKRDGNVLNPTTTGGTDYRFTLGAANTTITIEANIRFALLGARKGDGSTLEGMPGWIETNAADFTVNGNTFTRNFTLFPNRDYEFMILDRKYGSNKQDYTYCMRGCTATGDAAKIPEKTWWTLNSTNNVIMSTSGYGEYEFKIEMGENDCPKIYITNPLSYQITMAPESFTTGYGTNLDGGTLTAVDGDSYPISDEKYVKNNGSVTFTAAPKTGYLFDGFYSDANCETQMQAASEGLTYTISNIQEAQSVYAKFSEILKEVTVIQGDGSQSTVKVGVASHPGITAIAVSGKKFTGWSTNHVTVDNAHSKTTTITDYSDGYNVYSVTATWGDLDAIYFDISKATDWTNNNPTVMRAFFYTSNEYSTSNGGQVGTNTGGAYSGKFLNMERVDANDCSRWIVTYDPSNLDFTISDMKYIAFVDQQKENGDGLFSGCTVAYTEFSTCLDVYTLADNSGESKTVDGKKPPYYRSSGYWSSHANETSGLYVNLRNNQNEQVSSTELSTKIDENTFSASVYIEPNNTSGEYLLYFFIGSCEGQNYSTAGVRISDEDGHRSAELVGRYNNVNSDKVTIAATAPGDYIFKVSRIDGANKLRVEVEFPFAANDYRVIAIDNGDAHDNGLIYKHSSIAKEDLASFFVKNGMTVKLQKCSSIDGTIIKWENVENQLINITNTEAGVYNFKISQDGDGTATLSQVGAYTGDFYIRTDKLNGGWTDYATNSDNLLTKYGEMINAGVGYQFNYFQTKFISGGSNVKCVVANDYSKCISDTLTTDDIIDDANTPEEEQTLPQEANVRFMWNSTTNEVKRAYLSGSANTSDRYLVLNGNKDANNNSLMLNLSEQPFTEGNGLHADEAIFTDMGNWVYQIDIKAKPGCAVKLMADYNNKTQYFIGAANGEESTSRKKIMDGTGTTAYKMRAVYDFKNNQLVAGWIPDNETIESEIKLGGDMLLVRNQQSTASQIKFGNAADAKVSSIQQIYGVLELNKQDMTNRTDNNGQRIPLTNKSYDRCLYWISFPFSVQISKVFGGVGHYGTKWIMQKYRGDLRAQKGWFAETATFWEYMREDEFLEPYVGYVLCLDPDYFDEVSDEVWQNVDENVAFYFPSEDRNIDIISSASKTVEVPEHECKIERTFIVNGKELSHITTDSHWNVIGIPAFEDLQETLNNTDGKIGLNALYKWDPATNNYTVQAVSEPTTYKFEAMHAYMVQFHGDIVWSNASVVQKSVPSPVTPVAPRRLEETAHYMAEIEFHQGNKANDHTYINLAENATTDFMLNEDMMKIDNAGCPNIYSFAGNYNVAYNETSKASQTIDLGVSAPAAGNYKFHMPSDFTGTVTLIDNVEQTRTNLQVQDYELYLDKGTYNDRFQLEINLQSVVTNLDNVFGGQVDSDHAVKFIRDDKMFILRSGSIFDATGKRMK